MIFLFVSILFSKAQLLDSASGTHVKFRLAGVIICRSIASNLFAFVGKISA